MLHTQVIAKLHIRQFTNITLITMQIMEILNLKEVTAEAEETQAMLLIQQY